jgi:hypothetical protein
MPNRVYTVNHTSGANVYFRVFNGSGQVFDFDDDTFKALGSATTPYIAATEQADADGTGRSDYAATINTSDLYSGASVADFRIKAYDNATPAAGDVAFGGFGFSLPDADLQLYRCRAEGAFTSSAGTEIRIEAWLERNGQTVILTSGTCAITIRETGAGSDLLSLSDSAPNSLGRFEITQINPGFTDDRLYMARVTITVSGTPYVSDVPFPIYSS